MNVSVMVIFGTIPFLLFGYQEVGRGGFKYYMLFSLNDC